MSKPGEFSTPSREAQDALSAHSMVNRACMFKQDSDFEQSLRDIDNSHIGNTNTDCVIQYVAKLTVLVCVLSLFIFVIIFVINTLIRGVSAIS